MAEAGEAGGLRIRGCCDWESLAASYEAGRAAAVRRGGGAPGASAQQKVPHVPQAPVRERARQLNSQQLIPGRPSAGERRHLGCSRATGHLPNEKGQTAHTCRT